MAAPTGAHCLSSNPGPEVSLSAQRRTSKTRGPASSIRRRTSELPIEHRSREPSTAHRTTSSARARAHTYRGVQRATSNNVSRTRSRTRGTFQSANDMGIDCTLHSFTGVLHLRLNVPRAAEQRAVLARQIEKTILRARPSHQIRVPRGTRFTGDTGRGKGKKYRLAPAIRKGWLARGSTRTLVPKLCTFWR